MAERGSWLPKHSHFKYSHTALSRSEMKRHSRGIELAWRKSRKQAGIFEEAERGSWLPKHSHFKYSHTALSRSEMKRHSRGIELAWRKSRKQAGIFEVAERGSAPSIYR